MEPKRLTEEEINNAVSLAVREAIDFVESEVAPDRIKAQRYFDGKCDLGYEDGRSRVVATKVRDTIRAIKPALMRVFLQTDKPVEFIPRTPQAVMAAEQATKYASYIFNRNNGFDVISDVFHDALIKKIGIAKVYYDENPDVEFDEYTGLTQQQAQLVEMDEEVEVIEMAVTQEAEMDEMGMEVMPALYDMKVAKASRRGEIKIKSVAPEDFFVDRSAVSIDDCYVCGHSTEGRVGDLVEMGFDFERIYDLSGETDSATDQEEDFIRRGWDEADESDSNIDPSMRKILITEAYMRMDIEGVGVPKLYKFLCAGQDHEVLDYELCDYNPFAVFEVDPEPHTFFGRSLADIIIEDQNVATSLLRGLLDNIAMLNNPRLIVNDQAVEMDDVLNSEIGGIIRTSDIGAVREIAVGGAAASALPAIQFYDEVIRAKTGVSGAAMGLDADALQSQTAAGVNAAVQAATAVSELIARTLAEGGMKQLFKTVAKLARANPNPDEMMRIDGQFVPVDPSSWGSDLDMTTNVGLGNGAHDQRMAMMQQALQLQMQVFGQYGPMNGIVTMTGIRNTVADMMALGGIHNADRYIQPMNPQIEQQLMMQAQQMQAMQQQQGDPNMAFMQAEQMKAQTRAQVDMQKAAMEHQRKMLEMAQNDDLQRDGMAQDLLIEAAKILGQYGTSVDVERVKAEQNAPRQMMPMQGMM
jgi:hypothetical protein